MDRLRLLIWAVVLLFTVAVAGMVLAEPLGLTGPPTIAITL